MIVQYSCLFFEWTFALDLLTCHVCTVLAVFRGNVSSTEKQSVNFIVVFTDTGFCIDGIGSIIVQISVQQAVKIELKFASFGISGSGIGKIACKVSDLCRFNPENDAKQKKEANQN